MACRCSPGVKKAVVRILVIHLLVVELWGFVNIVVWTFSSGLSSYDNSTNLPDMNFTTNESLTSSIHMDGNDKATNLNDPDESLIEDDIKGIIVKVGLTSGLKFKCQTELQVQTRASNNFFSPPK